MAPLDGVYGVLFSLNESPSEKEGKSLACFSLTDRFILPQ